MATRVRLRSRSHNEQRFDAADFVASELRVRREAQYERRRPMMDYALLVPEPEWPLNFERFPYQLAWYSDEVAAAEEVIWLKSTQVGMCLAPWTRVLMADLTWREIGTLAPGDELVSVDEDHGGLPRGRRLRRAVVLRRWDSIRPTRRLMFDDGRELVASREHRFLTQRGRAPGSNMAWRSADRLRAGQRIRCIVSPHGEPSYEDGWMSGLLDGEGCLRQRAAGRELVITQQPGAVYDRAVAYLRARGYAYGESITKAGVGKITLGRSSDVMRLLGATRPVRLNRTEWWQGMSPPGTYGAGSAQITEICDSDVAVPLVDIETTTGTFIAEGFVSHNSGYAWRWAVRQSDQFGETGVYIFPTDTHVREFGDERIEPSIEASQYLRSRIGARFVRHKGLKRIGRGFLHLRGSNSKAGAQSVAAQFIVFDEYDFLDPVNLPQIERRITGARQLGLVPRVRRLGTPTIDGHGIAAAFAESDQRIWMVRCPRCNQRQALSWEENVRWCNPGSEEIMRPGHDVYGDRKAVERVWRQCRVCPAELDVSRGEWVAQAPERKVIGFHVSRLIVPFTDLTQIVVASRSSKPGDVEAFENNDLGRPYSPAESALDAASILRACQRGQAMVDAYSGPYPTVMGVDVAGERDLNVGIYEQLPAEAVNVPNPRRALWIGQVKDFEELVRLIVAFRVAMVAIDSNPERRLAKAVRARFPGRVVLVVYKDDDRAEAIKVSETGADGTALAGVPLQVTVNRTEALDAMMDAIRQERARPPLDPPPGYLDQLRAPKRRTEITKDGRVRRVYVSTGTAGDDYAHTEVYVLVATEMLRHQQAVGAMQAEQPLSDEELGFRRVRLAGGAADQYRQGLEGL